jgi:prepilin signal peptidase PulO-like enzyme (type II secretory pathway)
MITRIIQGILYTGFLTFGSVSDIRTHTVPDWVWMGVAGTALIGMKLSSFPSMLFGAAAVLLIEVPLAVAMKDRAIGGADIKISAAGAFLLGWRKGLTALIAGLMLSILIMPVVRAIRHEKQDTRFALVPFLAAGQLVLYYI